MHKNAYVEEPCSCHECTQAQKQIESFKTDRQLIRGVVTAFMALFMALLGGCWITNEWTRRQIEAVGGESFRVERNPNHPLAPGFRVVPKEEKK